MSQLHWEFAPTGGGDRTGDNDPVVTPFRGNIYYVLARESIQNIIDAHIPNSKEPAKASFTLRSVYPKDLPGFEELQSYFEMCLNTYRRKPQVVKFYESAIFKIKHNNPIDVLVISDYNTVGLTGKDTDDEGNYVALMKSVGNSSKSTGEGGSFGLGKGAYFVASTFRTVFISSVYEKDKVVFQGKARLASFKKDDDNWIQGNGSYGLPLQKAVRTAEDIPNFFKRDEQGLDYHIIGFKTDENWETQLAKAVINWFWYAILKGYLVVSIGNSIEISDSNLDELIHKYFDISDRDTKEEPNPLPYYYAYTDKDHKVFNEEKLPALGKVSLYVLEKDGFPNTVAYIRKTGMVIQKNSPGSMKRYAATFICEDDYGNKVLRAMESETHTEWSKDNVREESPYYKDSRIAETALRKFVRNSVNEINKTQEGNASTIGGLEEYLSLPVNDEENGKSIYGERALEEISAEETGYEISLISDQERADVIKQEMKITGKSGNTTPGIVGGPLPTATTITPGPPGPGGGGKKDKNGNIKLISPKIINFYRTYASKDANGKLTHTIIIKNTPNLEADIEIKAGTEDSTEPINIVSAKDTFGNEYKISDNIVKGIKIVEDGFFKMIVTFDTNEKYSLNIAAI